jgi:hypothetical protein
MWSMLCLTSATAASLLGAKVRRGNCVNGAHGYVNPKKKDVAVKQHSKAASEEAPQPTKREQEATEKKSKAPTKRAQRPKTLTQEATMEKKPKAPTKCSLKDEQELEREERDAG